MPSFLLSAVASPHYYSVLLPHGLAIIFLTEKESQRRSEGGRGKVEEKLAHRDVYKDHRFSPLKTSSGTPITAAHLQKVVIFTRAEI